MNNYFQFQQPDFVSKERNFFPNGSLLHLKQQIKLNEFYGKTHQRWRLSYKASCDGFHANSFHSHCNNRGSTITVIRCSNHYIFGGYTASAWTSNDEYQKDNEAFLFTLTNPHKIPPTKYPIKSGSTGYAICCKRSYDPVFGGGHDICIEDHCDNNSRSRAYFPTTYNRDGVNKLERNQTNLRMFSGATVDNNVKVVDSEVFQAIY